MNTILRGQILECLSNNAQAVTYGALAPLINSIARSCMNDLPRNHQNSWVVRKSDYLPSGFAPNQIDPRLPASIEQNGVISTSDQLSQWLTDNCKSPQIKIKKIINK